MSISLSERMLIQNRLSGPGPVHHIPGIERWEPLVWTRRIWRTEGEASFWLLIIKIASELMSELTLFYVLMGWTENQS